MKPDMAYRYLIDPGEVLAALGAFSSQPVIGLDTETFYDSATGQNRLSLLQLAAPSGEVIVIDALAAGIDQARPLIEDPAAMMAAHNARFDDGVLRGAGFEVAGLVDTLRLARKALKLQSFSLSSVSDHLLGLPLDKTYQRSDWRRRPLDRRQLDYAALDARIALLVFQRLAERLEEMGRWEIELRRARIGAPQAEEEKPPKTPRRSIELRPLTADERQLVESLRAWRKSKAESERLPLYMICQDKTLDHLAILRPTKLDELNAIYGLGPAKIARYGQVLLDLLQSP
jgi:ribonuclease D